jgi:catechol 2,3-dioxygenase-like lactoylglutathione lyase family enzyme
MLAKIRHVSMYTDKYDSMVRFYETVFHMKKITTGTVDESGKANPNRGHISDGVVGMAILPRYAGIQTGVDHFGFEVEDIQETVNRLKKYYPQVMVAKALDYVPFAGLRSHDLAGAQFDLSQQGIDNIREGYTKEGWDQTRWLNHLSIRTHEPTALAEFYQRVFDLREAENFQNGGSVCLTDGKVKLLIRPCDNSLYRGLREGIEHIGFRVESVEQVKQDLQELTQSSPESAPRKIAVGRHGHMIEEDLQRCPIGTFATSDPDGILLDLSED